MFIGFSFCGIGGIETIVRHPSFLGTSFSGAQDVVRIYDVKDRFDELLFNGILGNIRFEDIFLVLVEFLDALEDVLCSFLDFSPNIQFGENVVQVVVCEETVVRVRVLNRHIVLWHKVSIQKNIKMSMKQALLDKSYTQAIVKWPMKIDQEEKKLCENK